MFFYYLDQCNREGPLAYNQIYPIIPNFNFEAPKLVQENLKSTSENSHHNDFRPMEIKHEHIFEEEKQVTKSEDEMSQKAKKMKKSKPKTYEEDYNPQEICQKKAKKFNQNIKRNIIPNIIHQIFCFLQKRTRSQRIVQRYFKCQTQSQEKGSVNGFYNYQKLFKEKTNNYINSKGLRQLNNYQEISFDVYSRQEQDLYLKINRVLVKHFLVNQLNLVIMTSLRMKGRSREYYLQAKRKIRDILEQMLQED